MTVSWKTSALLRFLSDLLLQETELYTSAVVLPRMSGGALITLDKEGWGRGANCLVPLPAAAL
jgi:hypothetical protein